MTDKQMAALKKNAFVALKEQIKAPGPDGAHREADAILCRLLSALGFADVVELWKRVDKWYS